MLGKRLKFSRERLNLTQATVSGDLGIEVGTLSGYERDYRKPSTDMLAKLADRYNVSTDYLLDRTDDLRPVQVILDESNSLRKYHHIIGSTPPTPEQKELISMDKTLSLLPEDAREKIIAAANAILAVEKKILTKKDSNK